MNANIEALVKRIEDRMTNSCPSCAGHQENEQNELVVCDSCYILMKDFRAALTEQAAHYENFASVTKANSDRLLRKANERIQQLASERVPPSATMGMIAAAESVEDLYKRGTPETWGKVWRAMLAAVPRPSTN